MSRTSFKIQNSPSELAALGVSDGAAEFTKSELATVSSLGWELSRLEQVVTHLSARVKNKTLSLELCEFLRPLLKQEVAEPQDESDLRINWGAEGLRVEFSALPEGSAQALALLWLPALGTFWERTLRRAHFQRLRRVLPRAWFLVQDDPPPGAVIPGLQITSWSQLTSAHGSFWMVKNGEAVLFSAEQIKQAAGRTDEDTLPVIIADHSADEGRSLLAHYVRQDRRVDLQSLTFLSSNV